VQKSPGSLHHLHLTILLRNISSFICFGSIRVLFDSVHPATPTNFLPSGRVVRVNVFSFGEFISSFIAFFQFTLWRFNSFFIILKECRHLLAIVNTRHDFIIISSFQFSSPRLMWCRVLILKIITSNKSNIVTEVCWGFCFPPRICTFSSRF